MPVTGVKDGKERKTRGKTVLRKIQRMGAC
jgi:hypothetical protein